MTRPAGRYVKSIAAGILAAVAASAVYVVAVIALALLPLLMPTGDSGAGAVGASISEGPVLVIAIAAFVLGSYWTLKRGNLPGGMR